MLSLGIDFGTSKIAITVIDQTSMNIFTLTEEHHASLDTPSDISQQSVQIIYRTLTKLILSIPSSISASISAIGVTGQMHGVVLNSTLITWKDRRASISGKLSQIQNIEGCSGLRDGFGFTTLALSDLSKVTRVGTIHDFFVSEITNSQKIFTDPTNAASWGLFDIKSSKWTTTAISALGIPFQIVPMIVQCGSLIGGLCSEWSNILKLPQGIPVTAAIGDNQASVLATAFDESSEIYVTIGTGMQLSAVIEIDEASKILEIEGIEIRAFPGEKFLIVNAPLCGGEGWRFLVDSVRGWISALTGTAPKIEECFGRIDDLALAEFEAKDLPVFEPHFLGERWDQNLSASIKGICLHNFSLGKVAAALAKGIAKTLRGNVPASIIERAKRIVASGNAIRQSKALLKAVELEFGLPVIISEEKEEAATGAAILAARNFPSST